MHLLYHYFHQKTKDKSEGGLIHIPKDSSVWPENWKTIQYKSVERAEQIPLTRHEPHPADFYDVLKSRASPEEFGETPLSLDQLATILQLAYGEENSDAIARRLVPSGGARYPLEIYVLAWNVSGLTPGVYHYNIVDHALEKYFWQEFKRDDLNQYVAYPWVSTAGALVIMTGVFERSTRKYGSRGYRYVLLEAGHVGQNMSLAAKYVGCNARALAGTHDERLEELLSIDGARESLVYSIALGS